MKIEKDKKLEYGSEEAVPLITHVSITVQLLKLCIKSDKGGRNKGKAYKIPQMCTKIKHGNKAEINVNCCAYYIEY